MLQHAMLFVGLSLNVVGLSSSADSGAESPVLFSASRPLLLAKASASESQCKRLKKKKRSLEIKLREGGSMKRMISLRKQRRQVRDQLREQCR